MKDFIKNVKFAWTYTKKGKNTFYLLIILNLVAVGFSVLTPILSAKVIISLSTSEFEKIILIALVIFIVEFSSNFIHYITRKLSLIIYRDTLANLGIDVVRNVLRIENKSMDKNGSGMFIQRIMDDSSKLADVFSSILDLFSSFLRYFGVLVAIFIINKYIFIYIIIVLIILYFLEKIRTNKYNKDDKEMRTANEKVAGFIGETVRGSREIKVLNSEKNFIAEFAKRLNDAKNKEQLARQTSWSYRIIIWNITDLSSFLIIVILVIFMRNNFIESTIALVLYNYANNIYYSVYLVGNMMEFVKSFNLSSERIFSIISSDEFSKEKFGNVKLNKIKGDFEFDNVSFGYNENKILDKLSFKIKANETVAFVGKSGSGKTTIFNLLCKMYEINSGTIRIDGIDIKELDKDSIRGNISIINQNPYIFNMSIKDNLKIVKPNLTDKEMKAVIKTACLEEFIKELPEGYDTIIGEGGINLSGGQKQRLAIARALIQKTEIILFDEATSALDNETQEKIQEAINNMKNEYTILIIAHRLSTIINADRILYLEDGKIIAEGKHSELMKNSKKYKKLYEMEIMKQEDEEKSEL